MKFLQNPKKRRPTRKRRSTVRRKKRTAPRRSIRKRSRSSTRGASMAKKKRRSVRHTKAATMPRARHRNRRFRRNPPGVRGIAGMVTNAAKDSLALISGRVVARAVPQMVKLPSDGIVGIAARVAVGIIAAIGAQRISARTGEMVLLGAVSGEVERIIKAANVPVVSAALGDSFEDDAILAGIEDADVYGALGVGGYDGAGVSGYDESGMGGYLGDGSEDWDG